MTLLLKDPGAALDYAVDWGGEYLGTDSLLSSGWSVAPDEPGGVTIVESAHDGRMASVTAAGGAAGRLYRLTNRVVFGSGLSDSRTIVLRVEKR